MMKSVLYSLVDLVFVLFSRLIALHRAPPYWLGRLMTVLLRDIIRYRRKVVAYGIDRCFASELSNEDRSHLAKAYYDHLGRIFVEMLFGHARPETIVKRVTVGRSEPLIETLRSGRSALLIGSHMNNWEWCAAGVGAAYAVEHPIFAVYKPLSNTKIDARVRRGRHRLGITLVSMANTYRTMVAHRDEPSLYLIAADQRPAPGTKGKKVPFFHDEIAFIDGYTKLAERLGLEVFFVDQRRQDDGTYVCKLSHLPNQSDIVRQYAEHLEANIRAQPSCWLWSHDRWRRSREGA